MKMLKKAGEEEVEELVDRSRDNEGYVVRYIAIDVFALFGEMWFFDHWSSGRKTYDLRRASLGKVSRVLMELVKLDRPAMRTDGGKQ